MALFERRKDAKPSTPEETAAEESKVAAAPPEPPRPQVAEPAPEPGQPAPPPAVEAPPAAAESEPAVHTVAAGESLADLATRYGVPAEEIARQNHVPPPGRIHAGQVFVIRS